MECAASTLHTTSEHGISSITTADAHTSTASSRLISRPRRFKWTRPFRRKTKSGFCACAFTFQTQSVWVSLVCFTLEGKDAGRVCWKYASEVHVFNMNSARYVGLSSAVLLHQNLMLFTVEGDHARAAQRVKTSTVEELNASRDAREQP
jgi:hypothetical protein